MYHVRFNTLFATAFALFLLSTFFFLFFFHFYFCSYWKPFSSTIVATFITFFVRIHYFWIAIVPVSFHSNSTRPHPYDVCMHSSRTKSFQFSVLLVSNISYITWRPTKTKFQNNQRINSKRLSFVHILFFSFFGTDQMKIYTLYVRKISINVHEWHLRALTSSPFNFSLFHLLFFIAHLSYLSTVCPAFGCMNCQHILASFSGWFQLLCHDIFDWQLLEQSIHFGQGNEDKKKFPKTEEQREGIGQTLMSQSTIFSCYCC